MEEEITEEIEVPVRDNDEGAEIREGTTRSGTARYLTELKMTMVWKDIDTDEELAENFKTFFYVKEKLDIELLFLCNGEKCLAHRLAGPMIGEPISFVKEQKYADPNGAQQPIAVIRALVDKLK